MELHAIDHAGVGAYKPGNRYAVFRNAKNIVGAFFSVVAVNITNADIGTIDRILYETWQY